MMDRRTSIMRHFVPGWQELSPRRRRTEAMWVLFFGFAFGLIALAPVFVWIRDMIFTP